MKTIITALLALLFSVAITTDASAQRHRHKWDTDDRDIYVPRADEEHVVYDGDRVIYDRRDDNYRRHWYRHYEDRSYKQYRRHAADKYDDKYYRRNHTKYYYRRDDTRE